MDKKFDCKITEHIATIQQNKSGTYTTELNRVSFDGRAPVLDLRRWDWTTTDPQPLKGITLTAAAAAKLRDALNGLSLD